MYTVVSEINFEQVPNKAFPFRNRKLTMNFLAEFEAEDSWKDLTNDAKLTIPKNVYYPDKNGKFVSLGNINTNIGGFGQTEPVFLRGDRISISSGYHYSNGMRTVRDVATLFSGYISRVNIGNEITLECEDNMYVLKQTPAPNKFFDGKKYTLEAVIKELLSGTGFTVNALTKTTIGDFRTQDETVCQVLARLKKDYHFDSYFRGNELRIGTAVYIESEAVTHKFNFQKNIISDDLSYQRKDDVVLSARVRSTIEVASGGKTKDGYAKKKKECIEYLLTFRNGEFLASKYEQGKKGFTEELVGERHEFWFAETDPNKLIQMGKDKLMRYFYDGFKGKFLTFGIPFVKQGDNVVLSDNKIPERNGTYKVKSVEYSLSVDGGLRQEIELDYKIL